MRRLCAGLLVVAGLCGCSTITPDGAAFSSSENAPYVPIMIELAGLPCSSILADLSVKTGPDNYKFVRGVGVKNSISGRGEASPTTHKFEPGEYHVTAIFCLWDNKRVEIARRKDFLGSESRVSFGSFVVTPAKMLNIGKLRIHFGAGNRIGLIDVVDLSPESHVALRREYPLEYAKMEKRFMTPSTTAIGIEVDAIERVWRRRY